MYVPYMKNKELIIVYLLELSVSEMRWCVKDRHKRKEEEKKVFLTIAILEFYVLRVGKGFCGFSFSAKSLWSKSYL